MNESEGLQTPEQEGVFESRFGNRAEICRWLAEGEVRKRRKIDLVIPKLRGVYSNIVEVAILPEDRHFRQDGRIAKDFFQKEDNVIYLGGVFKPFAGESALKKGEFGFDADTPCYKREIFAYLIDLELGFEIVPPTVERKFDSVGSLQLFIPPTVADWEKDVSGLDREALHQSEDYFKIALFDYIVQNPDRKDENYLVSLDGKNCFAIDHGYILPFKPLGKKDVFLGQPREVLGGSRIPDNLIGKLKNFIGREKEIIARFPEYGFALPGIFERTRKLVKSKIVLK